jgi:hypothetical protein
MIRDVKLKKDDKGTIQHVRIVFGPHYFVELHDSENTVSFSVGYTHHGFKADASDVNGELEQLVNEIRRRFPEKAID